MKGLISQRRGLKKASAYIVIVNEEITNSLQIVLA